MDITRSQYRVFYKSLAIRMACAIIIVSVIPLIIMAALSRHFFLGSYTTKVWDHYSAVVRVQQREIDGFLTERLHSLSLIGLSTPLETLQNEKNLEQFRKELQEVYGQSLWGLSFCTSLNGDSSCVASPGWRNDEQLGRDTLNKVRELGAYVWEPPASGKTVEYFILAVRVDQSGQKGILLAMVGAESLTTLLAGLPESHTGNTFILNGKGEPLAALTHERKQAKLECTETQLPSAANTAGVTIGETKDASALCVRARLSNSDWVLQFVAGTQKAYEALEQPRMYALATLLLGVLGIVAVAMVVSNRFSLYVARADQEKQLINEQLVQAGKLAALGEMAANMGHEINNPVGIIVQEAELIKALLDSRREDLAASIPMIRDSLEEIQSHGTRCRNIILKLVSFSRHDEPAVQPVELNALIREVVAMCHGRARSLNVEMRLTLDPGLPKVHVAPSDAKQVILNLISNSLDALEQKSGTIEVRTSTRARYVVVEVEDTGPGIPQQNLGRVFEPFFTTKPEGKGTGLGLAICYVMMKRIQGDITVTSEEGTGTTFHLFFSLP
jgi:two-component system, NtrC family, sensor kinase